MTKIQKGNKNVAKVPNLRFPEFTEEWEVKDIKDLGDFIGGGTPDTTNQKFWEGKIPWISSSDITIDDIHNILKTRFITEEAVKLSATKLISKGGILMVSRVGIGKFAVADEELCTSQDFTNLITTENEYFLCYYFNARSSDFIKLSQGTSIKGFTTQDIKSAKFFIPSIIEQTKIASFLSLIDERIQTQNKIIKELNLLKITITKRIFSGQLRFKNAKGNGFPDWEHMTLGDVGEVKMCRRIFNDETSSTGDIPFFKIGSFGKEANAFISKQLYEDYRKRFSFPKKGDILISAAGTIGRTVVYKGEDAYYQDSNIVWIDNNNMKVVNDFLYYILQTVKYNTEGGTIQRLYNNILKSTKFSCPSLPEQTKIANFLSSIDSKIDTETQLLQKIEEQKKFLLQQMFV